MFLLGLAFIGLSFESLFFWSNGWNYGLIISTLVCCAASMVMQLFFCSSGLPVAEHHFELGDFDVDGFVWFCLRISLVGVGIKSNFRSDRSQ